MSRSKLVKLICMVAYISCSRCFASEMSIRLYSHKKIFFFYEGKNIPALTVKIRNAPHITIEDVFLCPEAAQEGWYLLSINEEDGSTSEYVIADDSYVWATTDDGENLILSCSILNELRGVLIRWLLENIVCMPPLQDVDQ